MKDQRLQGKEAEQYVYNICKKLFLDQFTYMNPKKERDKKEFCDCLVLLGDYCLIFSIKDSNQQEYSRYLRKTVLDSVKQLCGANRYLEQGGEILINNDKVSLNNKKKYYIAISFHKEIEMDEIFPEIIEDDKQEIYIHVFDKISFDFLFKEIGTISDFISYLEHRKNNLQIYPNETVNFKEYNDTRYFIDERILYSCFQYQDFVFISLKGISSLLYWEEIRKTKEYSEHHKKLDINEKFKTFIDYFYTYSNNKQYTIKVLEHLLLLDLDSRVNFIMAFDEVTNGKHNHVEIYESKEEDVIVIMGQGSLIFDIDSNQRNHRKGILLGKCKSTLSSKVTLKRCIGFITNKKYVLGDTIDCVFIEK